MKITNITIEPEQDIIQRRLAKEIPQRRLAKAHIVIDGVLRINDILILRNDRRIFVEFPCPKGDSAHPYIIPLNRTTRAYIEHEIIGKYVENHLTEVREPILREKK